MTPLPFLLVLLAALLLAAIVLLPSRRTSPLLSARRRARTALAGEETGEHGADGAAEDSAEAGERRIVERAAALENTRVWDVMTPRVEIFAWPADRSLASIAAELSTVRYSRVPVYRESIDDVVGILYTRDAYRALLAGQRDLPLSALAREPFFVPGSIPLIRLLGDFQARRIHLGVVIDEYGGTDGLVTLEDLLEELVGEIMDENDPERQPIVRLSRNEILVEGQADLREVNHFFNTDFPQLEHRSLNGYLLDELGRVPGVGEELEREGVRIQIVAATDTQVVRARLLHLVVGGNRPEEEA